MELNIFLLFAPHKKWELHTFSLYTHYEFNKFLWLPLLWGQMVQWWINEMMNRCSDFCVRIIAWVQSVVYTFINIFWVVCDRKAPFFTSKKREIFWERASADEWKDKWIKALFLSIATNHDWSIQWANWKSARIDVSNKKKLNFSLSKFQE